MKKNLLIAQFMTGQQEPFGAQNAKYHESWDALMPVVAKIESLTTVDGRGEVNFVVTIETGYCVISQGGEAPVVESQDVENPERKIEVVYDCVCQFIEKWNDGYFKD